MSVHRQTGINSPSDSSAESLIFPSGATSIEDTTLLDGTASSITTVPSDDDEVVDVGYDARSNIASDAGASCAGEKITRPKTVGVDRLRSLRKTEYGYLDQQNHVYLDYTGAGLAARAQINAHEERQRHYTFGNPHTHSPTSVVSTEAVEQARRRVLKHFNASADDYTVIFTANASAAARLVGESYPFTAGRRLVLTADNHNSINGLRMFAKRGNSRTKYVRSQNPDLRVSFGDLKKALKQTVRSHNGLLAYPAQSNFSGVRHPLEWISYAQSQNYDVLLDAAAYLPTKALDLSKSSSTRPNSVIVSWYKLFGYPTGVGCLIAQNKSLARLQRPWFSGGTIQAVTTGLPWHSMAKGAAAFEDGTLNYLSIPDVTVGLDWISDIGMSTIGKHVQELTKYLLSQLLKLRHKNKIRMFRIYGPTDTYMRGGNVAFNFLDASGRIVDDRIVARDAAAANISLRTGCFCNPGCGEDALELTPRKVLPLMMAAQNVKFEEYLQMLGLPSVGAIRVSLGLASSHGDVDRFLQWAKDTYQDRTVNETNLPPRDSC